MSDKTMEKTTTEPCGCEFFSQWDENGNSSCFLSKCRCQKHYDEQFVAKWIDAEGEHCETYEPSNPLPLEKTGDSE